MRIEREEDVQAEDGRAYEEGGAGRVVRGVEKDNWGGNDSCRGGMQGGDEERTELMDANQ